MKKILVLSTFILLVSVLADALICKVCEKYKKGVGCSSGQGTCEAAPGQQCKRMESSQGDSNDTISQGCTQPEDVCGKSQEDPNLGSVKSVCCSDRDHCNQV